MGRAVLALTVANRPEEIARLLSAFEAFGDEAGLSAKVVRHVMLAMEEAVLNTINYGFPDGGDHVISIDVEVADGALVCDIRDRGIAFDPLTEAPVPDLDGTIMERRIGGLGIHILKKVMDSLCYRREGDVNRMHMIKKL